MRQTVAVNVDVDSVAAAAIDEARAAAREAAPGLVGEHLGVVADDERVATHLFATLDPAYRGWCWGLGYHKSGVCASGVRQASGIPLAMVTVGYGSAH